MITVNDVTQINPIPVFSIATPTNIEEVVAALQNTRLPVSIGGGHFSMGGHTASAGSLHLDLRRMNRVLKFSPEAATITVQAGIRWCDIQKFVDPHGFAVKIMQSYANFTVGGTLSVNAHGRYMGLGPVVLSVRAITLVLASGEVIESSPQKNTELFYAAIGGYGAIGIITEVELDLVANIRVERKQKKLALAEYWPWFDAHVRRNPDAVFHNFDLYAPHYSRGRAVTWSATEKPATAPHLQPLLRRYWIEKYFLWVVSETVFGKFRREFFLDPLLALKNKIHWRNYEAGYDVAELEPFDRARRTYVLQEYFVPVAQMENFSHAMATILKRHHVNALNISVRHAVADSKTLMAWARGETFAFVLYYKQRTRDNAKERVAVWTRELIDAVLEAGGTYYLPYQLHATSAQFHRAYPRAKELFALKQKLDPDYRLRGALWDRYYQPEISQSMLPLSSSSLFKRVYGNQREADRFYTFLQNIFHLMPEDRLHTLIKATTAKYEDDEGIYHAIQAGIPDITPTLAMLTYALPSLALQKKEMGKQAAKLLGKVSLNGYVEIGTTGRYVTAMKKYLDAQGPVVLVNDKAPGFSPADIVERGGLRKIAKFVPLNDYAPIALPEKSADLVSCFIGLHHMAPEKLNPFVQSIARIVRLNGYFIVRDHDVKDQAMDDFVALAHTVFNAGMAESWSVNQAELRYFASVNTWIERIEAAGFRSMGAPAFQQGDPSDNALMAFVRVER